MTRSGEIQDEADAAFLAQIALAARVAHAANRVLQAETGEAISPPWHEAPDYQRASTTEGVRLILAHPDTTAEEQHLAWVASKVEAGWVWGEVKDAVAKTHPCILPYEELPASQRIKDAMFGAVVRAVLGL